MSEEARDLTLIHSSDDRGDRSPLDKALERNVPAPPDSAEPISQQPTDSNDLGAPHLYFNRELSWLEFNARVLREAETETVPLLERLKFHAIFAANLDEFFMVRVAGLRQQLTGEVHEFSPDGMTPAEQLGKVSARAHELVEEHYRALTKDLLPKLAEAGIVLLKPEQLTPAELAELDTRFHQEIFPILTPITIDVGHPFPRVRNKSINLGVMLGRDNGTAEPGFGVVQVPMMLHRFLDIPSLRPELLGRNAFVLLEDLIARHVGTIFPGFRIRGVYAFRVTRNFDLEIDEEEAEDLLQTIQQELRKRERGNAVRLEVSGDPLPSSLQKLAHALKLDLDRDVFRVNGPLNPADLMQILGRVERRDLRDEPFTPFLSPQLREADDLFAIIREGDILLHQPYDSFETVVEFLTRAAEDPDVLAIKQTLYRAGGDSPVVRALARAAESGKQVTAVVELKARFDEESNIQWARTLEQSGCHVVYGLVGLKTHAKCLLVVRRERNGLRRYAHLSTGNYNPSTARHYTDMSLFTARQNICEDASSLFNLLTGYSAPPKWNALIVAPLGMHEAVLGLIAREAEHARAGRPAKIVAKMNALVDEEVIEALYRASQAGVQMTLLVRGVCCLRPGVPGVSERIEVRGIIDRFLEHARVFHFANGGKEEVFIGSADWMPRNFHRRVEVMIPIEDPAMRARLIEILQHQCVDTQKSWGLQPDGRYTRVDPGVPFRAQQRTIETTRDRNRTQEAAYRASTRLHFAPPIDEASVRRQRKRERRKP